MKIFDAQQVRAWDNFTIAHEPVLSIELMERAANACLSWITQQFSNRGTHFIIFCGRGNNGGDGLALARLLIKEEYKVSVYVLTAQKYGSPDFESNLVQLREFTAINYISVKEDLPIINKDQVVIDALFGTGLLHPLEGFIASICSYINSSSATVVSVDLPSGLFADISSKGNSIIQASYTLTFQQYKLAFLVAENAKYVGKVQVLDINLHRDFLLLNKSTYYLVDEQLIGSLYKRRDENGHKGTYGHALIIAGSYGMMGAAVLATSGALRSGAGKITAVVPSDGYEIMQISVPEAMCKVSGKTHLKKIKIPEGYDSIGVGPGIGRYQSNKALLESLFTQFKKPLVIDADALNEIADEPALLQLIPENSIITPHPKEFERLFGATENDFARLELALQKSVACKIFIVLKGHFTFIACPDGCGYFNMTGNAGMATGGSGDVLTGIITGLLAQSNAPLSAALLGVYLHGTAGDIAARQLSEEAMIAGDIIKNVGSAFLKISKFPMNK